MGAMWLCLFEFGDFWLRLTQSDLQAQMWWVESMDDFQGLLGIKTVLTLVISLSWRRHDCLNKALSQTSHPDWYQSPQCRRTGFHDCFPSYRSGLWKWTKGPQIWNHWTKVLWHPTSNVIETSLSSIQCRNFGHVIEKLFFFSHRPVCSFPCYQKQL